MIRVGALLALGACAPAAPPVPEGAAPGPCVAGPAPAEPRARLLWEAEVAACRART